MAGILDRAKTWMTPERAIAMQGLGLGLSQMAYNQPVNLSPAYDALKQRQEATKMQRVMETPGIMDKFTPQQRAVLASMPEGLATKVIMESVFAPDPEPTKGIAVGGNVINPITGEVIYQGQDDAKDRKTAQDVNGVLRYVDTGEPVFPGVEPGKDAPITKNVTLADGSEAMVQWNPDTEMWDPAPIPQGGATAQPRDKLTESQSKIELFSQMQTETAPVLDKIEEQWDPANMPDAAARALPIAGNYFQSPEGQIYQSAAMAWAEGALRISTGAAATEPEIRRIMSMYFAVPGDTPETVRFKSQMRQMYSRAIEASRGGKPGVGLMLPDDFANIVAPQQGPMTREQALKLLTEE